MGREKKQTTAIEYVMIIAIAMYVIWTTTPDAWRTVSNARTIVSELYYTFIANPVRYTLSLVLGLGIAALYLKREKRGGVDDPAKTSGDLTSSTSPSELVDGDMPMPPSRSSNAGADFTDPGVKQEPGALAYGIVCAIIAVALIGAINAWKN